ncbi:MAG: hypothetical protein ACLTDR_12210 [Adlercreutzia equolifaciens]
MPEREQKQADYEMGIIIQQGFPAYFLIVQEYIEWARSQGIGVGPGRGSAAGAIVAYAMGITDLDPMPNGLMFERIPPPERVEMPDIDVDFEQGRREEVINHIKDVYGEDHVSQVITFGTLQAKNAVRDSARVLDYPYGVGDRICKMIWRRAGHHHRQGAGHEPRPEEGLRHRRGRQAQSSTPRSPSRATCAARACTPAPPSSAATP